MNVKAVYENGVLKPKEPLPLEEHEEVELDVRRDVAERRAPDPRGFVGFIKSGIKGMPVAAHHDRFLGQDQYAHLKGYFRNAMAASGWSGLSQDKKLERFIEECRRSRPDFQDLWQDMDRIPHVWSNAFEYCREAIEREAGVRQG
jgi:predicted DNA-binding antitoxin AbrB/MazE fold protein